MKDLKIGMPILVTTTCRLDNEIIKLESTTLVDAYTSDHSKKLQIKLGAGHWGACPTRDRDNVFINSGEVNDFAKVKLTNYQTENLEDIKNNKRIFIVECNHNVTIKALRFSRKVESLAEGSFTEFTGSYASMKIKGTLPPNVFYSLNSAIDYFVKLSTIIVRK